MLAPVILTAVMLVMWGAHALLLRREGRPVTLRMDALALTPASQKVYRAVTNVVLIAALLLYPVLRGQWPREYYAAFFPGGRFLLELPQGFVLSIIYLGLLYLAWLISDNIHIRQTGGAGRSAKRLLKLPLIAGAGALMEELIFRGVLLAGVLEVLPPVGAVMFAAVSFAMAHYVRPVKRYWTFWGHLVLGLTLCVAFACTRALWLPLGLHAGGIFTIMGLRPFVRYTGPGWLVGASIFPYAGLAGLLGLSLLAANVWYLYGGFWGQ